MKEKDLEKIANAIDKVPSIFITAPGQDGDAIYSINAETNTDCMGLAISIAAYAVSNGKNAIELQNIILNSAHTILNSNRQLKVEFLYNLQNEM